MVAAAGSVGAACSTAPERVCLSAMEASPVLAPPTSPSRATHTSAQVSSENSVCLVDHFPKFHFQGFSRLK